MRGENAKAARRVARAATPGKPERQYNRRPDQAGGPVRLIEGYTRRVYQNLKRNYKERARGGGN